MEIIGNRRTAVRNSYDRHATIRKIYDRRKLIIIAQCDRPPTDSRQMCDSLPTDFWQKMGIFTADLRQILTASPSADLRRKRGFFRTFYEWHFLPFCELYGKVKPPYISTGAGVNGCGSAPILSRRFRGFFRRLLARSCRRRRLLAPFRASNGRGIEGAFHGVFWSGCASYRRPLFALASEGKYKRFGLAECSRLGVEPFHVGVRSALAVSGALEF